MTISIDRASIKTAAANHVLAVLADGFRVDDITSDNALDDWHHDDCLKAAGIAPEIIAELDAEQRAALVERVSELLAREVVAAAQLHGDDCEDEDEDEDETISIDRAGIEDAAHAFVAHLADDGHSGDQIIKKLIDWTSDDCFEAASIAPKIIDSLDDDQRAELFIELMEMIESEVVRAIKDYCDDGNDDDDDAEDGQVVS